MIPPDWVAFRRPSDDELVGYLTGGPQASVPVNLAGFPLAEASDVETAQTVLTSTGLASLDQVWLWRTGEGEAGEDETEVRILSAYPGRVLVVETEYGYFGPDSARHELELPVDLRPARPH